MIVSGVSVIINGVHCHGIVWQPRVFSPSPSCEAEPQEHDHADWMCPLSRALAIGSKASFRHAAHFRGHCALEST
jgi:hypothetical protein